MKYDLIRRKTRPVRVGNITVGGNAPISVQSMLNTDAHDVAAALAQTRALEAAGCDIVRLTVPDLAAADTIYALKNAGVKVPLVADIHFDYRVALAAAERGADTIRINPGNIGDETRVREVADACRRRGIPIRIGVNGGSLEKNILAKYGAPCAEALVESALAHASLLEKCDFEDIVISIKSSDVATMIAANRLLAAKCDYPLHLGVTEAGGERMGSVKSAIGVGALLADGIGDTVRVSLTADPVAEVAAARRIFTALGIEGQCGLDIVSCPTCGRTKIDLIALAADFERAAREENLTDLPLRVALMGCVVNGPGEAREADLAVCGGDGEALLIAHGEPLRKIPEERIVAELIGELKKRKTRNDG